MMLRSHRLRLVGATLLLSTAWAAQVQAEAPAVEALIKQAQYWRSKGREDLAEQAMRRARALNPKVQTPAAAPAAKSQPKPEPKAQPRTIAAPRPVAAPAPSATPARVAKPKPQPAAQPAAQAAAKAAAKPKPAAQPAAAALSPSIRAGQARVAGYAALNSGSLDTAANEFQKALSTNRRDPEALGGLGLVRLRQSRFDEAADLLGQASRLGRAEQWTKGLATATFFSGLDKARTLLGEGRLGEAEAATEQLVQSGYSEPAPALELLGDIFQKQGRYADSAEAYRQALSGGAKNQQQLQANAARSRAMAAAQRSDDTTAEREFQNGLLLDREDPWIRYEYARFLVSRGRLADADALVRALSMSGDADSIYAAALLSNDLGRPADAERMVASIPEAKLTAPMRSFAIGVKVDSAIARTRMLAASGQQAQAVNVLRQLGAMEAVPPYKLPAIADALANMGDAGGAATLAQNALDGGKLDLGGYSGVIGVMTRVGREDLANMALQRASQLAGDTPEGRQTLARMGASLTVMQADRARLAGRFAESFDMLQSAYAAAPDNAEVMAALARLYQAGNMAGKAAQTYQIVLARDPRNRDALLGLAQTAQAAGDNALSEKAQDQVLRIYPQDYQVRLTLAQVERARGNEGAAVRLLKDARALYTRGNAMVAAGNPFAGMGPTGNGNPFRDQMAPAPGVQPLNPFALGNGTRVPQLQSYTGGGELSSATFIVSEEATEQALFHAGTWDGAAAMPAKSFAARFEPSEAANAPMLQTIDYPAYPPQGYPQQAYPQQAYPQQTYPAQPYPTQSYPAQSYPAPYPQQAYPQQQPYTQQQPYPQQQAYPQQPYPQQQAYPQQQSYPQAPYPQQSYPAQPAPAQGYPAAAAPGGWGSPAGSQPGGMASPYPADPVLAQIQSDIAQLSQEAGPRAEMNTSYRSRSGEKGLGAMREIKGSAKLSAGVLGGRVYGRADAVVIDSGRPTGSGLARFGRNATPEAQAIVAKLPSPLVQAESQHDTGVAGAVGFESDAVQAEVGITPAGMGKTKATFYAGVSPKIGNGARVKAWVERKPVTDSIVSYAGTVDPVSGSRWGQVMRTGGGAGFSYDEDGSGFYAEGRYNRYAGTNVRDNHNIEANVGGYLRVMATPRSRLTTGINVNYQTYANSQNYFTYGNGGYFSPQDFVSVSFPVNYSLNTDSLELKGSLVPGFQSYSQEQTSLYPTDSIAQEELDKLKGSNADVRSYYDSVSKTGFAVSADASAYYRVGSSTRVGAEASYNTFGSYDEFRSLIGVRQSFGSTK